MHKCVITERVGDNYGQGQGYELKHTSVVPEGLRMKISAQPCVNMGTNSARLDLSLNGGEGWEVEGGGWSSTPLWDPRTSSGGPGGGRGPLYSPSGDATRGLRL